MAKITRHGGATATATVTAGGSVDVVIDGAEVAGDTAVDLPPEVAEAVDAALDSIAAEGVDVPADGTLSPAIEGDGTGTALPDADGHEHEAPASTPAVNARKEVWADYLADAGVSRTWLEDPDTTKANMVDVARGLADGVIGVDTNGVPIDVD